MPRRLNKVVPLKLIGQLFLCGELQMQNAAMAGRVRRRSTTAVRDEWSHGEHIADRGIDCDRFANSQTFAGARNVRPRNDSQRPVFVRDFVETNPQGEHLP